MRAKEQWLSGDVPAARAVLEQAHGKNSDSEELFLAAFKLEFENSEPERARVIAQRAKTSLSEPSARVWLKAAMVARELGNDEVRKAQAPALVNFCMMLLLPQACRAGHKRTPLQP